MGYGKGERGPADTRKPTQERGEETRNTNRRIECQRAPITGAKEERGVKGTFTPEENLQLRPDYPASGFSPNQAHDRIRDHLAVFGGWHTCCC
jgi:hypothetical protein